LEKLLGFSQIICLTWGQNLPCVFCLGIKVNPFCPGEVWVAYYKKTARWLKLAKAHVIICKRWNDEFLEETLSFLKKQRDYYTAQGIHAHKHTQTAKLRADRKFYF
jgi:hypothetical protein